MPEVLGDAALLVDPASAPALTQAIGAVLQQETLARDLRARGLRQVARYSWAKAAEQTRAVYGDAVAAAHPAARR
jgi:glycosyltransferase involved in cell wall biosynthesis